MYQFPGQPCIIKTSYTYKTMQIILVLQTEALPVTQLV